MAEDKDIVIDLIDTIHTEEVIARSERLSKLLRDAAEEIQHMRLYMAYPPMMVDRDDDNTPTLMDRITQGSG